MWLVYCGPEKCSCIEYQKVLHGNPSMRVIYCASERWSYVEGDAIWKPIHNAGILWA